MDAVIKRLYDFFSLRIVYHSAIWIFYLFFCFWLRTEDGVLSDVEILGVFVKVFMLMGFVYFNYYYLIPKFLDTKKILLYIVFLTLLVVMATPVYTMVLYLFEETENGIEKVLKSQFQSFVILYWITIWSTMLKIAANWIRDKQTKKDLENARLQSELNFLRAQINPHFLFNSLNSLYALTLKKSDLAPEQVLRLSEMLRYILYECNDKLVALDKEIAYLKNYIAMEKLRYGDKVEVEFTVEGDTAEAVIAPLVLITFVENAFKHGVGKSIERSLININLVVTDNNVEFKVSNKVPPQESVGEKDKNGGIGLENTRRRLDILYGKNYSLSAWQEGEVYICRVGLQPAP